MEDTTKSQKNKMPVAVIVTGVLLAVVVVGGIVFALGSSNEDKTPNAAHNSGQHQEATAEKSDNCVDETGKSDALLVYDENEKFVPTCIKISSGTTLTYRNDSDFLLDVGADPHPTHTGNREVSKQEFELPVKPNGGTATTVMEKTGTFGLHNHENASATATVIVE